MKSSKSHDGRCGTEEIRLHKIYKALASPHTTTSKRYLELLASAPSSTIDQLLCKISSRARRSYHSTMSAPSTAANQVTTEKLNYSEDWPLHRLLACFEAILSNMKSRLNQQDLLSLRSFKACVRLVLDTLSNPDNDPTTFGVTKAHGAKCWYKLLDHLARLTQRTGNAARKTKVTETGLVKAILTDIRSRQVHLHILQWATDVTEKEMSPHLEPSAVERTLLTARSYGLRGLFAQASFFGMELILDDAYRKLLCQTIFYYFGFGTGSYGPVKAGKRRRSQNTITPQFSLALVSCQLLDALCKLEEDQKDRLHTPEFGWNSVTTRVSTVLARTWTGALLDLLHHDDTATGHQNSDMLDKGRPFYCLTTVLLKSPSDSPVYLHLGPSTLSGSSTLFCPMALSNFFAQLVYSLQQPQTTGSKGKGPMARGADAIQVMQSDGLKSVYTTDTLIKLLTRLCHISWRCMLPHLHENRRMDEMAFEDYGKIMTGCMTNFLLAFTTFPVSVETLVTLASGGGYGDSHNTTSPCLLSMDLCADVVIRGYFGLTSTIIERCQTLLGPLLETIMQYIQVVPVSWRVEIGPRIAWCLRSQMALLDGDDKLDGSILLSKFQKLVIYLLHDSGAIKQFADSSNGLGKYIWEPTIALVHEGLAVASSLTSTTPPTVNNEHIHTLTKAKRALVALEKVSQHPRACERLVDTTILELIDASLIPCAGLASSPTTDNTFETTLLEISKQNECTQDLLLQAPAQVWSVYGLLLRLLASLAGRTSLLRSKLLQERQLIDVVMGLLWRALQCESTLYTQIQQRQQKDNGIKKRIEACQNGVISSLQVVYAYRYDSTATLEWLNWKQKNNNEPPLTLVSALVAILVPWSNDKGHNGDTSTIGSTSLWYSTYSNQILNALNLLEHLTLYELCGKQMIQDNGATLHHLSQVLATLSCPTLTSRAYIDASNPHEGLDVRGKLVDNDNQLGMGDTDDDYDTQHNSPNIEYLGGVMDDFACDQMDDDDNKRDNGSSEPDTINDTMPQTVTHTLKTKFIEAIMRILTKVITNSANLKLMILTDSFTRLFGPLLVNVPSELDPLNSASMATQLGNTLWKRVDELDRLFQFFGQNEQDINHRHELTAVALVYASFWETTHWHSTLGLFSFDTTSESIVYSTSPFGMLCHMLMFDDTDDTTQGATQGRNQARRRTAAQALTTLALSFKSAWRQELDQGLEDNEQQLEQVLFQHYKEQQHESDLDRREVTIRTSDTPETIRVNTRDLTWASPAFQAMLSDHYSETSANSIYLHDIAMTDLQHFILVSQLLQEYCRHDTTISYDYILNDLRGGWDQIVTLIHIADRYSCVMIQLMGERWIMQNIKKCRPGYLSGCMNTYRYLRDKYHARDGGGLSSSSWPFCRVLNQCVKAILLNLVNMVDESSFIDLMQTEKDAGNLDDIESFCNAALFLFQRVPLA